MLNGHEFNKILEELISKGFIKKKYLEVKAEIFQPIIQDALIGIYKRANLKIIKSTLYLFIIKFIIVF